MYSLAFEINSLIYRVNRVKNDIDQIKDHFSKLKIDESTLIGFKCELENQKETVRSAIFSNQLMEFEEKRSTEPIICTVIF